MTPRYGSRYGLDTNVLVRLARLDDPQHDLVQEAVRKLAIEGVRLCYTPQNIGELWNVSTRPLLRNGLGLSPAKAYDEVRSIERKFTLLEEDNRVYGVWVSLLQAHEVRGLQVHDAHLAATLQVHGVSHLLTFNGRDFARYSPLIAVHPADIAFV